MNDKLSGVIRHLLTLAAGYLVAKNVIPEELVNDLVAGAMAVVAIVWSVKSKG